MNGRHKKTLRQYRRAVTHCRLHYKWPRIPDSLVRRFLSQDRERSRASARAHKKACRSISLVQLSSGTGHSYEGGSPEARARVLSLSRPAATLAATQSSATASAGASPSRLRGKTREELTAMTVNPGLADIARNLGVRGFSRMRKAALVEAILAAQEKQYE